MRKATSRNCCNVERRAAVLARKVVMVMKRKCLQNTRRSAKGISRSRISSIRTSRHIRKNSRKFMTYNALHIDLGRFEPIPFQVSLGRVSVMQIENAWTPETSSTSSTYLVPTSKRTSLNFRALPPDPWRRRRCPPLQISSTLFVHRTSRARQQNP